MRQQPINGRLSLREVGKMEGVSASALAGRLGVPSSVSLDERLGLLRRKYNFTMQDVRAAVSVLKRESSD